MKNPFKLISLCILLIMPLYSVSCSRSNETEQTQPQDANITIDAYNEKIAYCLSQISSLEEQLKVQKQESFVNESNYKLQIAALEQTIAELRAQQSQDTSEPPTAETGTSSPFTYVKEGDGIRITRYTGSEASVEIPEKIDDLPVRCVGESAFEGSGIKSLTIPEGVTKIDWFALRGCSSLSEIKIPASVKKIEYGAFDGAKPSLVIICPKNSFAQKYAESWGYTCVAK